MKTPTKKEIREILKITKERARLKREEEKLERALVAKYSPCELGDIIEGGIHEHERGVVAHRTCDVFDDGTFLFRINYYPMRGNRRLKQRRIFTRLDTIKVVRKADAETLKLIHGYGHYVLGPVPAK